MRHFNLSIIFLLFALMISASVFAQKSNHSVKRADKLYEYFDYQGALELYKTAANKAPDNLYVKGRIGNCYKSLGRIGEAEEWYQALADTDGLDAVYKFYYAQSLMANGKYTEAVIYMNDYYDSMSLPENKVSNYPPNTFEENDMYTIELVPFNSEHADFAAYQIKDDIYFVSNRKDDALFVSDDVWSHRPFTQLYRIKGEKPEKPDLSTTDKGGKEDEEIEGPSNPEPEVFNAEGISKWYHEGPICFDRNLNDMYITRSNYTERKPVLGNDDEINLKILKLTYDPSTKDFGNTLVDNISFQKNEFSTAYPTITSDGNYLVFASDMPGGFGGLDLYVAENIGGIWGNPINLGSKINTHGNESYPHILADGTMFFASDGHLGLGGLDIFVAALGADGYFLFPENIRAPINSQYDDFSYFEDVRGAAGFFSSNRPGGVGNDDIYSFTKQSYLFEAVVYDSKSNEKLINCSVALIDVLTSDEVVLMTDNNGYVSSSLLPNNEYTLRITKETYLPEEATFTTAEDDVYAEIPLVKDFGIVLDVTVVDKITQDEIPEASVTLINMTDDKEDPRIANSYGKVSFVLDPEKEYRIKADKDLVDVNVDYLAVSEDFNTFGVKPPASLFTNIELDKQEIGVEIAIDNIYYDLDKYYIRDDAAKELDLIVKLLEDNMGMEIELSSHTDCRGSAKYNMWLSAKRAEAAVNYLIEEGISYRRLTAAGYGETRPVNGCICEDKQGPGLNCSDLEHQDNRRTVFTILKF